MNRQCGPPDDWDQSPLDRFAAKWQNLVSRIQGRLRYTSPQLRYAFPRLSHPDPLIAIEDRAWSLSQHVGGVESIRGIRAEKLSNGFYKREVDYKPKPRWLVDKFFNDAFRDAAKLIPPLFKDTRVREVSLGRFGDFTDLYGRPTVSLGSRITITRSGNRKLNWDSTNAENLISISRSGDMDIRVTIHPDILEELQSE